MTDPRPLSARLKEDNWDLHEQAERDTLPQHLVRGTLPREAYVEMLGQMYLANRVLDARITEARGDVPILNELVGDRQLQGPYLLEDLAFFGVEAGSLEPRPGTAALIAEIERAASEEPIALFGLHYVREGANNGNRFVAMKVRAAYGLEGTDGTRYLDPYGGDQRRLWDEFKTRLDEQALSEDEKSSIVASARRMFELIMATHRDHDLPEPAGTAG
ncbi:MAG: biliverdin-producing heme oxygenase [Planctomycetota bacterium]